MQNYIEGIPGKLKQHSVFFTLLTFSFDVIIILFLYFCSLFYGVILVESYNRGILKKERKYRILAISAPVLFGTHSIVI